LVTIAEILMEWLLSGATPQTNPKDGNTVLLLVVRQLLLPARKPQPLLVAEEAEAGSGDGKL
jgi:hypothetical protein